MNALASLAVFKTLIFLALVATGIALLILLLLLLRDWTAKRLW